jgi:hypothetical protein
MALITVPTICSFVQCKSHCQRREALRVRSEMMALITGTRRAISIAYAR